MSWLNFRKSSIFYQNMDKLEKVQQWSRKWPRTPSRLMTGWECSISEETSKKITEKECSVKLQLEAEHCSEVSSLNFKLRRGQTCKSKQTMVIV